MTIFLWVSMATGPGVHEERLAHQAGSIRSGEYECVTMVTVKPCLSCFSFVFVLTSPDGVQFLFLIKCQAQQSGAFVEKQPSIVIITVYPSRTNSPVLHSYCFSRPHISPHEIIPRRLTCHWPAAKSRHVLSPECCLFHVQYSAVQFWM